MKIYRIAKSELNSKLMWISIDSLEYGYFNEKPGVVDELKESLMQNRWDKNEPILVYNYGDDYTIMNGHHRVEAAISLGMDQAWAIVVDSEPATKIEMLTDEITDVENLARKDVGLPQISF
jgi:hypothetical protein